MKPFLSVTLVTATLLIGGCGATSIGDRALVPAFDAAAVRAVLDSLNADYDGRFRTDAAAYYNDRYTADACVMPPGAPRVCGMDAIRAFYWNNGDSRTTQLDIVTEEVTGIESGVTEVGNYRVRDDEGTVLDEGKFIAIYRSETGKWKVHREIWNSDRDPYAGPKDTAEGTN